MKKIILWMLLIILVSLMVGITYYVFVVSPKEDSPSPSNQGVVPKETDNYGNHQIVTWNSYLLEVIDGEEIVESNENTNYSLHIGDVTITMCTIEPNNCDVFKYEKKGKEYVMITDNEKLIKSNFKIFDDVDDGGYPVVKINKYWDDGAISVFYLKKSV